MNIH
ncbi:hypothetical protein D039_1352A, partial [Vibrio parahaemolyticus EKP-028]|jgi:hypothetical protein